MPAMHKPIEKRWIWPFELEEQIGAGGMGIVYKARFVKNDRRVALKLLPANVAANPTLSARFERELSILKEMRHPNIVHCFGGTCEGEQWFYAMELVEGGTIESLLDEQTKLPWERVVEFGLQTCAALEYAHAQGVIHRDVKPANLLLTKGGKLKLGDFGLAMIGADHRLTSTGKTLGTLLYMAPEQIRGNPPLSNKTDLYALGCVLFEMLTGQPPFSGHAAAEILNKHLTSQAPRIVDTVPNCPPLLEAIVVDLMQKDPAKRPENAQSVAKRLSAIVDVITVKPPRTDKLIGDEATRIVNVTTPVVAAVAPTLSLPETGVRAVPKRVLLGGLAVLTCAILWSLSLWSQRGLYVQSENLWLSALKDENPAVRAVAARSLGEMGPPASRALAPLVASLADTDFRVRKAAVTALGNLGQEGKSATSALLKSQKEDENVEVRNAAETAAARIRTAQPGKSFAHYLGLLTLLAAAGCGTWIWMKG